MSSETAKTTGLAPLSDVDPELFDLIEREKCRQWSGLELIASENFTSRAVMDCLGSALTNKYSEGLPGKRYYGGNEFIDKVEILCQERALAAYHLNPEEWGVNVQPYSGSPANLAVYTALLETHDRIMGLDLPSGGHLTHGYYVASREDGTKKSVSAVSKFFESLPYQVNAETGLIDYDKLEETAMLYKPKMLVCGASAYPRDFDYARMAKIARDNGAFLMMDMAHISGLVATGEAANPFEHCDIVTTTTHKSLRGPRSGMIFFRRDARGFEAKINAAVFPGLQGGPHEHQIAAVATQLREVATPEFKVYCAQIRANARALAGALMEKGYKMTTNGTDNHLMVWDLRPNKLTGSKFEKMCDAVGITLNKNTVVGDRSAVTPGGVRIGTPALTTRGMKEADFVQIAEYLHEAVQLSTEIQSTSGKMLADFVSALDEHPGVAALRARVMAFARSFPMPGFDEASMKFKTLEHEEAPKGGSGSA